MLNDFGIGDAVIINQENWWIGHVAEFDAVRDDLPCGADGLFSSSDSSTPPSSPPDPPSSETPRDAADGSDGDWGPPGPPDGTPVASRLRDTEPIYAPVLRQLGLGYEGEGLTEYGLAHERRRRDRERERGER